MKNVIVISLLAVITILSAFSCNKDQGSVSVSGPDSLIFRRYNPMSDIGERSKHYILKDNGLYIYAAPFSMPAGSSYQVSEQKLPDSLYRMAQYLISNFPSYIVKQDTGNIIGCPGCSDVQVIELKGFWGSTVKRWDIDADTTKLPAAIRQYIGQAGVIIDHL